MVRDTGFEPVTPSVSGRCSTTELTAQCRFPFGVREARMGKEQHAIPFLTEKKRREIRRSPALDNPRPGKAGGTS